MTYTDAETFLAKGRNKTCRTVSGPRSTEIVKRDNGIAIKYHATDVVTLHPDGSATLNSGGWRTLTTKERINAYTPARVYQTGGLWYLGNSLFYDGMKIDRDGKPVKPLKPDATQKKKRQLDRMISNYIRAFKSKIIADKSLPTPNNGDCWFYLLGARFLPPSQSPFIFSPISYDFDHIHSHPQGPV